MRKTGELMMNEPKKDNPSGAHPAGNHPDPGAPREHRDQTARASNQDVHNPPAHYEESERRDDRTLALYLERNRSTGVHVSKLIDGLATSAKAAVELLLEQQAYNAHLEEKRDLLRRAYERR